MRVFAILATCGRHTCLERSVKMFLDQDYKYKHLIIFQNSEHFQELDSGDDYSWFDVTVINQPKNIDGKNYTSLGDIYNTAKELMNFYSKAGYIDFVEERDIITFWDDDDLFLPDHISKGVEGLKKGWKDSLQTC